MTTLARAARAAELAGLGVLASGFAALAVLASVPQAIGVSAFLVGQLCVSLSTQPVEVPR